MTFILTPGQRHESVVFEALMDQGAVGHKGPGRPKLRPGRVVGDKGYSHPRIRRWARSHGLRVTIPRRKDQHRGGPFDKEIYRSRNLIERLINRLKQFRRLATRYEKRADDYHVLWVIAAILLWL
jgi:transposase